MKSLFLLVTGLMLYFTGSCQPFPMIHYGIENGLPSNTIYSVYKDSKGFTWISTDKGIARYNGIRFEVFSTFNGLPDNEVFYFQEDLNGRLWLGTYNGELCYYKNDTFHTALNTNFLKSAFKPRSYIYSINVEKDSSVTFCYNSDYNFINIKNDYCSTKWNDSTFNKNGIKDRFLYEIKNEKNGYEIICQNSTVTIDSAGNILCKNKSYHQPNMRFLQNNNQFYLITNSTFLNLKPPHDSVRTGSLKNGEGVIKCLYFDGSAYLIISDKGVYYNKDGQLVFSGSTSAIGQDCKGDYWIGTLNNGLYVLSKNFRKSHFYSKAYHGNINFSHSSGSIIYFSNNSCLYYFDGNKVNELIRYKHTCIGSSSMLINEHNDFYRFSGTEATYIKNINTNSNIEINRTVADNPHKSLLWANNKIYEQQMNSIDVKTGDNDSATLCITPRSNRIYCMARGFDGTIWYSTHNNLFKINNDYSNSELPLKCGFKYFVFAGDYLIGFLHNNMFLICSDVNGKFVTDTIAPQDCIWEKCYKLDEQHILVSTNNLYRLLTIYPGNTEKKYSISILEDPYIPLRPESFCSDGQNCYFFKDESITSINISSLFAKPKPPTLNFEFLKTAARSYLVNGELSIPFSESKNIDVTFSTQSFGGPNILYQYSVSKNGDDWRTGDGEHLKIGNPGYGIYTVKIRAKTLSSDYSAPVVFLLTIEKPFWATWWFITAVVVAFMTLTGIIIRQLLLYAIRKKEQEHNAQMRFVKLEHKALNALMNPHFIFNTLNNLQSLFNASDNRLANKYLRVFADLIRQNMHNVSREEISLQREIDLVSNYLTLEKMRFQDKLQYNIDIQEHLDISEIMVSPLLIQPLVENSIKHGILASGIRDGFVQINVFEANNTLFIEVKDNGRGMRQKKQADVADDGPIIMQHKSVGLDNTRKRLEQLGIIQNKKITFTTGEIFDPLSQKHIWTVVTIAIPLL